MNSGITTEEAKSVDIEELLKKLSADKKGLSASESKDRLQKYGYNEITEKKESQVPAGKRSSGIHTGKEG